MQWLLIDSRVRTEGYISKLGLPVSGSTFPIIPRHYVELSGQLQAPASNDWERMPHYPQNSRVCGPQSWSEQFEEEWTFGPADSKSSCSYCAHCLALLFDVYCKYVCQMILNCHLGDNEHVRIDLCCFSICTDIHTDHWFPICGLGIPRHARRFPMGFVDTFI
jgi:hypothetical protein